MHMHICTCIHIHKVYVDAFPESKSCPNDTRLWKKSLHTKYTNYARHNRFLSIQVLQGFHNNPQIKKNSSLESD